ncbi:MAG TPA: DUF503 domain-containing protein [Candidatus Manganitrophaceae bacterium]|nr:DUF503 domain-containing protein [Candidatus Manganitrophaceae bacterium]
MVVGICVIELYIPGNGSLKGKRQILLSIKSKVKNRFNVAIAEVGEQDLWQKAILGVTTVANDKGFVNEVMDKVVGFISSYPEVQVTRHQLEFV